MAHFLFVAVHCKQDLPRLKKNCVSQKFLDVKKLLLTPAVGTPLRIPGNPNILNPPLSSCLHFLNLLHPLFLPSVCIATAPPTPSTTSFPAHSLAAVSFPPPATIAPPLLLFSVLQLPMPSIPIPPVLSAPPPPSSSVLLLLRAPALPSPMQNPPLPVINGPPALPVFLCRSNFVLCQELSFALGCWRHFLGLSE